VGKWCQVVLWHWYTEWSTVWVLTKPWITEENWPGRGLNPGLIHTGALSTTPRAHAQEIIFTSPSSSKIHIRTFRQNKYSEFRYGPGVDVMITIFYDFCQFSAKKLAFSQKPMLWSNFCKKLAVVWAKTANIFAKFLGKIFKKSCHRSQVKDMWYWTPPRLEAVLAACGNGNPCPWNFSRSGTECNALCILKKVN
jgi:hypothetical protein